MIGKNFTYFLLTIISAIVSVVVSPSPVSSSVVSSAVVSVAFVSVASVAVVFLNIVCHL